MLFNQSFTPENINDILKDLAKTYRKMSSMPAEITLIGGAAILVNYGFRKQSNDVDAIIHASSAMKDAANAVGDKFNLPYGWLNSDFKNTNSYSPKIEQYSVHYREYSHILRIRTMPPEYIAAMKLMSGRPYKHDLSDFIGILYEQQKKGEPLSEEQVYNAFVNLYDDIKKMPENSYDLMLSAFETDNLAELMEDTKKKEEKNRELLKAFENKYEGVLNDGNLSEILKQLENKQNSGYLDME
ncbi:MAG: hypothetical protein IKI37_07190 [Oscillospiraceae bacterium]|nr:hypothetical protein [Oscillospiraceae bacterium]